MPMDRQQIDARIRALKLTRSQIAVLTGIARSDLANFLNDRGKLSESKVGTIIAVLSALEKGIGVLEEQYPGLPLDLRNVAFLRRIIGAVEADAQALLQTAGFLRELEDGFAAILEICTESGQERK